MIDQTLVDAIGGVLKRAAPGTWHTTYTLRPLIVSAGYAKPARARTLMEAIHRLPHDGLFDLMVKATAKKRGCPRELLDQPATYYILRTSRIVKEADHAHS